MPERALNFWHDALTIWQQGGWVMVPLALLALLMAWTAFRLLGQLRGRQFRKLGESQWKEWVRHPDRGQGEVGEMIRYALEDARSGSEIAGRFGEIRATLQPPVERQVSMLNTLVAAAPLVGLLGTVFGMLVTFHILATGGGGDITGDLAVGIKKALYPPQVGLCIALPGMILSKFIRRQVVEMDAFLAQLESYTIQYSRSKAGTGVTPPPDDDTTTFLQRPAAPAEAALAPKTAAPKPAAPEPPGTTAPSALNPALT